MLSMKKNVEKEFMVVAEGEEATAGATIWWRLHGECDRAKLVDELTNRGIQYMPKVVEPETAIRRAIGCLRGKRRLVRPLKKRGSWAVIEEELDDLNEKLKHWTGPTVSLDKIGRAVFTNATTEEATQVRVAYDRYLDVLDTPDVSSWLIGQAERLGAVALREGGGIYYLPPMRMAEWRQVVEALEVAHPEHHVYMVPTVRMTREGARAILDSLSFEIAQQVAKTKEEVISGDLGIKALENRFEDTNDLLRKVSDYEKLLEKPLEALRETIANLSADVVAAKAAAEALKDDAS